MPSRRRGRKKIHQSTIIGQHGINIIEEAVLKMGYVWTPMGAVEAGIDGTIEIRDPGTGEMQHSIIRVQSKATASPLAADTGTHFEYVCDERDIEYWLRGNTPVILVRSRTDTREAYWVDVKDYFRDAKRRKARKIVFEKAGDRFDASAALALRDLAARKDAGLYFAPARKREPIYSNLLRVRQLPAQLFHATTEFRSRESFREELRKFMQYPPREWVVRGDEVLSVHDLSEHPWNKLVDPGTVEEFDTAEWSDVDDEQRRRDFVELLNNCLAEKLSADFVRFHEKRQMYYFAATPELKPRYVKYTSLKHRTEKEVFGARANKKDAAKVAYYRHSAFVGHFVRHDGDWFLEIEPTYHFTYDGRRTDRFGASRLTGIKRLEHNAAVLGQLHMWAAVLNPPATLFAKRYPHLSFDHLLPFTSDVGIDDDAWLKREDSLADLDDEDEEADSAADAPQTLSL